MKKFAALFVLLAFVLLCLPVNMAFAAEYKETALDKAYDWFTTVGKSGMEKDKVLVQNKSERLKRYAEKMAKEAEKEAKKAGEDMKKKLGL